MSRPLSLYTGDLWLLTNSTAQRDAFEYVLFLSGPCYYSCACIVGKHPQLFSGSMRVLRATSAIVEILSKSRDRHETGWCAMSADRTPFFASESQTDMNFNR